MTTKQLIAVKEMAVNGGNAAKAMRKAGYSESMAKNPHKMTHSKPVRTELERLLKQQGITLKKALKPIGEALQASKVISAVNSGDANGATTDFIDVPDYATRLKAADMSLKLLGIKGQVNSESAMSQNTYEQIPKNLDEVELSRAVFRKVQEWLKRLSIFMKII